MPTATTLLRSVITPAPGLTPELWRRAMPSSVVPISSVNTLSSTNGPLLGYFETGNGDPNNWQTLFCDSDQVFSISDSFAGCIASTFSTLPVTCCTTQISTPLIFGSTLWCSNCVHQTVYQTFQAPGSTYYNFFCANEYLYSALSVYRETPAPTTTSSFATTTTPTTFIATIPTPTTSLATTTTPTTSTTPPLPPPVPSKAWIAGPVLGVVVFIVAGVALWYLIRRRQRPKPYYELDHSEYIGAQKSLVEIDGRIVPAEIDGSIVLAEITEAR